MKQLLYILFAVTLFTACSSDDDNESDQVKTTIQIKNNTDDYFNKIILAYKDGEIYKKLGHINYLFANKTTDIFYTDIKTDEKIYLFTDNGSFELRDSLYWRRIDSAYVVNKETNNILVLRQGMKKVAVNTLKEKEFPIQ